jgi:hypothetical protein
VAVPVIAQIDDGGIARDSGVGSCVLDDKGRRVN